MPQTLSTLATYLEVIANKSGFWEHPDIHLLLLICLAHPSSSLSSRSTRPVCRPSSSSGVGSVSCSGAFASNSRVRLSSNKGNTHLQQQPARSRSSVGNARDAASSSLPSPNQSGSATLLGDNPVAKLLGLAAQKGQATRGRDNRLQVQECMCSGFVCATPWNNRCATPWYNMCATP